MAIVGGLSRLNVLGALRSRNFLLGVLVLYAFRLESHCDALF